MPRVKAHCDCPPAFGENSCAVAEIAREGIARNAACSPTHLGGGSGERLAPLRVVLPTPEACAPAMTPYCLRNEEGTLADALDWDPFPDLLKR
jgi:hypothetical protein